MKLAQDYPAVSPEELNKAPFPFLSFYRSHQAT